VSTLESNIPANRVLLLHLGCIEECNVANLTATADPPPPSLIRGHALCTHHIAMRTVEEARQAALGELTPKR
jgi:hypothetical protein